MSTITRLLTNKHVVIAMLVAPVLAVIAYFAVDASVSEAPKAAQPGKKLPACCPFQLSLYQRILSARKW